jgi:hypothetical protein
MKRAAQIEPRTCIPARFTILQPRPPETCARMAAKAKMAVIIEKATTHPRIAVMEKEIQA